MGSLLETLQPDGRPGAGLDPDDPRLAGLVADLPGNVLKGHGRRAVSLRFVRWADGATGRAWAAEVGLQVTTAAEQREQARRWRATGEDQGPFVGLYLTGDGFRELEHPPVRGLTPAGARAFEEGLVNGRRGELTTRADQLNDDAREWQPEYLRPMHALVLVAFNPEAREAARARLRSWCEGRPGIEVVVAEEGEQLVNEVGQAIEPFGFRENLSRVCFFRGAEEGAESGRWSETFPLRQVLRETAPSAAGAARCGSFLVFRKMEQDVAGFEAAVRKLATEAFGGDEQRAGAWVMGRFRDGTPLALHDRPGGKVDNTFVYAAEGERCPWQAHIRKMNPRGGFDQRLSAGLTPRERLPVRRSVPYRESGYDGGDGRRGLLFMAHVGDIAAQFEHLLKAWSNSIHFPYEKVGLDPLMGRPPSGAPGVVLKPPPAEEGTGRDGVERVRMAPVFARTITTRGGVYLWAPPRSFFADLAVGSTREASR